LQGNVIGAECEAFLKGNGLGDRAIVTDSIFGEAWTVYCSTINPDVLHSDKIDKFLSDLAESAGLPAPAVRTCLSEKLDREKLLSSCSSFTVDNALVPFRWFNISNSPSILSHILLSTNPML